VYNARVHPERTVRDEGWDRGLPAVYHVLLLLYFVCPFPDLIYVHVRVCMCIYRTITRSPDSVIPREFDVFSDARKTSRRCAYVRRVLYSPARELCNVTWSHHVHISLLVNGKGSQELDYQHITKIVIFSNLAPQISFFFFFFDF